MVDSILNEPTINNKESLINDIFNVNSEKATLEEPKINNNEQSTNNKKPIILKESTSNNNILNEQSTKINNNLEEPKINNNILNEQPTIISNNLKEPKTTNNLEEQSTKTNNNLEKPKANNEKPKIKNKNSNFVKIPKFLRPKKALLNPPSTDNKYFQHSITLSLYHKRMGKNFVLYPILTTLIGEILLFHQQKKIINNLKKTIKTLI